MREFPGYPEHEWDAKNIAWDLAPGSVAIEIGAFHGRWIATMAPRNPDVRFIAVEPQEHCQENLRAIAEHYPNVVVYPHALGTETRAAVPMGQTGGDGGSLVDLGSARGPVTEVSMVEITEALRALEVDLIDLCVINIEGYEFTLIPHMLARGVLPKILVLQQHLFAQGDAGVAQQNQLLASYYDVLWDYGTTLCAWQLRKKKPGRPPKDGARR